MLKRSADCNKLSFPPAGFHFPGAQCPVYGSFIDVGKSAACRSELALLDSFLDLLDQMNFKHKIENMKNTEMNSKPWRSRLVIAGLGLLTLVGFSACDKDDDDDPDMNGRYTLSGSASGDQEVPVVSTNASGSLTGSYDSTSNTLIYTINWRDLSGDVSMAHFHGPAMAGENAEVMLPLNLTEMMATGMARDTVQVNDAFEDALLSGKVYYNIHTLQNPSGEIRGQVMTERN